MVEGCPKYLVWIKFHGLRDCKNNIFLDVFPPCYFDNILFAKTYLDQDSGDIVGHLLQEISRVKKSMLDMGAPVNAELTSSFCRRFPIVQLGLNIRCKTSIKTHSSYHMEILERYLDIIKEIYIELI